MSDTPRTDAFCREMIDGPIDRDYVAGAFSRFARQLERELASPRDFQLTRLREQLAGQARELAEARKDMERECRDADRLLVELGLTVESCRTEGGLLNVPRIVTKISEVRVDAAIDELIKARITRLHGWMSHHQYCEWQETFVTYEAKPGRRFDPMSGVELHCTCGLDTYLAALPAAPGVTP